MLKLPKNVLKIFEILKNHEIYLIGGCVRDMLLEKIPYDYDFTTSATPNEVLEIFAQNHIKTLNTGITYGTVGVVLDQEVYEITTFRKEGGYKDFRRPSEVVFAKSLQEDVLRRDFSINAIAYHPVSGVVDYCHGKRDLENRILCSIGDANERFNEDALRILRGVGFASRFDLEVEEKTKQAMFENARLLNYIAKERIQREWEKILNATDPKSILLDFVGIFEVLFGQKLSFDIVMPRDSLHRAARLLKEKGLLERLCYSKRDREKIQTFMQWEKDCPFRDKIEIKKVLANFNKEWVEIFLQEDKEKIPLLREIFDNQEVYSYRDLEINGRDLERFEGRQKGEILKKILELVIEGKLQNKREILLNYINELII